MLNIIVKERRPSERKTYVEVDGVQYVLADVYESIESPVVSYRTYYRRVQNCLVPNGWVSFESLEYAGILDKLWSDYSGVGGAEKFIYEETKLSEHTGKEFPTFSFFLYLIGRYDDKNVLKRRLKDGWSVDQSLTVPITNGTRGNKWQVYCATHKILNLKYIGITRFTLEDRKMNHYWSNGSKAKFKKYLIEYDPISFDWEILESDILNKKLASERERYWIRHFDTVENGLNSNRGGSLGREIGKYFSYDGEEFVSIKQACEVLAKRFNSRPHIIEKRIRNGVPLDKPSRTHSKHPDAGSRHWRRWKSLLKLHPENVSDSWKDYESYKADTLPSFSEGMRMTRIDDTKPWGVDDTPDSLKRVGFFSKTTLKG